MAVFYQKIDVICNNASGTRRDTVADLVIITGVRESQPRVPDLGSQLVMPAGNIALI